MKKLIKLIAILLFTIAFSGCEANKEIIKPKIPKLRTCIVKNKKIKVEKCGAKFCFDKRNYTLLKKQNYRKTVCNELLNKQNIDFNKRFVK